MQCLIPSKFYELIERKYLENKKIQPSSSSQTIDNS